jgi:PAS domain S-box-containing protein
MLRLVLLAIAFASVGLSVTLGSAELRLQAPYLLPLASILMAAWFGGLWAGLLALVLLILGIMYFLLPPTDSFGISSGGDVIRLTLFALVAVCMNLIIEKGRRTAATLRATLASIDDAVIVTDLQGRITFMNPVAERLTGWTLNTAAGRRVSEIYRIVDEPSGEVVSSRIEGMLRDGVLREGMILGPRKERMLASKGGGEHPVVDSGSSVVDEQGERTGAVLVFRDVSEQRAAREAAERANRLKDEFLATVSHELRTPLNAVLGWTKMLRSGSMSANAVTRAIEAVDRNADALAALVNDLLDVSRIVTGQLRLNPEPTDIAQVVRESLETLGPSMGAKGLHLSADVDTVPALTVDANRIRQVVWNLLSNAIKFTPPGGDISVRLAKTEAGVEIVVSDTGQGIDAAQLPLVFNRFWQADAAPTRTVGGLGLGLSIVRHLIEAHAGTVTAASEGLGKGATFTAFLPASMMAHDLAPATSVPRVPAVATVSPTSLHGVTVLAVDDEPDSLGLTAEALRRRGADVRTAASADEAIQSFRERVPHVLVADVAMPGKDGYALLVELRSDPRGAALPAVAVTAYAGESHRQAALDAGFSEHLEKPVNPEALVAVVLSLARQHL